MQSFVQEYTNVNKGLKLHKKCKLTTQTTVLMLGYLLLGEEKQSTIT